MKHGLDATYPTNFRGKVFSIATCAFRWLSLWKQLMHTLLNCMYMFLFLVLVVVSHAKNAHPTRNMNLSHFSLKGTWVTFDFFARMCLSLPCSSFQAVAIHSISGFLSIANTHHLWMISWTNISPLHLG